MPQDPAVISIPERTVIEVMAEVLADLPAIGKGNQAPSNMGGYSFRGIEDVMNALNPLLSAKGLFFIPTVIDRLESVRTTGAGKALYVVNLKIEYRFFAAGVPSYAQPLTTVVWGEGTDSGDKATQKAMTAALKSMLTQVFAISTKDQADDDAERHDVPQAEANPKELRRQAWGEKSLPEGFVDWDEMDDEMEKFQARVKALPVEQKDAVAAFMKAKQMPWPLTASMLGRIDSFIQRGCTPEADPTLAEGAPTPAASASGASDPAAPEYAEA